MKNRLIFIIVIIIPAVVSSICPDLGESTECYNDQDECPDNYIWESDAVCNVCASCKEYLDKTGNCSISDLECPPGYNCDKSGTCTVIPKSCEEKKQEPCLHWTPECIQGVFAPKQCKGQRPTGRCFCVNEEGDRIFGEQEWSKAENMTCACSRQVEYLRKIKSRKDVTLHCTEEGNYEELQCDDGLCWCAEEKTGISTSHILPETMMTMLHCYNETEVGSQYLRKCESKIIAQARIEIEMAYHQSYNPHFSFLRCDIDGSYAPIQFKENQLQCVWKDNVALGFAAEMSQLPGMNCRCAWDKKKYGNIELTCEGNGNYQSLQHTTDGTLYTVDEDGFPLDSACLSSTAAPSTSITPHSTIPS